jgi:hypothetical protein
MRNFQCIPIGRPLVSVAAAVRTRLSLTAGLIALFAISWPNISSGQILIDPGFEQYAVSAGGFIKPVTGPWSFVNDAGVVEPPAPNSSTGPLNTWSATFAAIEGEQYPSTYAGGDTIRQSVSFGAAGDYRVSAYAAAPSGSVTIPPADPFTLGNGQFSFTLGNAAIGTPFTIAPGSDWSLFTADFTIASPGDYQIGIRNNTTAPYFINYDAFQIVPVPEPTFWQLMLSAGMAVVALHALRKARQP